MKSLTDSKNFRIATLVLGGILIALIAFAAGMHVGLRKAKFSYRWGENYERNFIGKPSRGPMDFFGDFEGRGFRNAHGLAGTIISMTGNNLVIKDRDGKENTVSVTDKTLIKKRREDVKISDLKQDDQIVVVGNPGENGVINADIIRVFENLNNSNSNNSQIN